MVNAGQFKSVSLKNRFWDKVVKTDSCWIWVGKEDIKGYGRIRVSEKQRMAYHVAYYLRIGEWVPFGYQPDHTCKNPSCVRIGYGHIEIIPIDEHVQRTSLTHPNRVKTHCVRGHDNWYVVKTGARRCRTCESLRNRGMI